MGRSHPRVTVDDIIDGRQVEALQLEALNGGPVADPKAVGLCKNHWVFRLILKSAFHYIDDVDGLEKVRNTTRNADTPKGAIPCSCPSPANSLGP
jgi:hypothetical protein